MLLDIGLSFIYLVLLLGYYPLELSPGMVLLTVFFGLLPDIDAPIEIATRGTLGGKEEGFHRKLTHYPVIYIPVAILVYLVFGEFIALLFVLNIVSHLLHDMLDTSWGIRLLWPISNNTYRLFNFNTPEGYKFKLIMSRTPDELKKTMQKYGDENWFKNYYLRLTPVLVTELFVLVLGCAILLIKINL